MRIVVVGSGVVGGATGKGFVRRGHSVTFVDIDPGRIDQLRTEGLSATDMLDLRGPEALILLTLPTPSDASGWRLEALESGVRSVAEALRGADEFHIVATRSTVPPGTTEQLVQPLLVEGSGKIHGEDFSTASNPEFLRAACALEDFLHPWMTVLGSRSKRTREILEELYRPFGGELRTFADPAEAEFIKAAHNIYNAAKISFWNEMGAAARHLGLEPDALAETVAESAEGSWNRRYGIYSGAPYGGACLPKDTVGFLGFARDHGIDLPLLESVIAVNESMTPSQIDLTVAAPTNGVHDPAEV